MLIPINRSLSEIEIPESGKIVHLKGFGFIKIFRFLNTDDEYEYWGNQQN